MPPTQAGLESAERWVEDLTPERKKASLIEGLRLAFAHRESDVCYVLSSAFGIAPKDHSLYVNNIRAMNDRGIPIHTVGLVCDPIGELFLRQLSEGNYGEFVLKQFHKPGEAARAAGPESQHPDWRNELVNETSQKLCEEFAPSHEY